MTSAERKSLTKDLSEEIRSRKQQLAALKRERQAASKKHEFFMKKSQKMEDAHQAGLAKLTARLEELQMIQKREALQKSAAT
jgi:hypothetical protein